MKITSEPVYECTKCGLETERDLLTVKKIAFLEMGVGGRTIKTRVVAWLCPRCVASDPDFLLEKFKAPGSKRVPVRDELVG